MHLIKISASNRLADDSGVNMLIDVDWNGDVKSLPFTWHPDDTAPMTHEINVWLASYYGESGEIFKFGEPEIVEFDPVGIELSPRQFRMALVKSGASIKSLTDSVAAVKDQSESETLHIHLEYTTLYRWDDSLTQSILRLAFKDDESAMLKMWKLGSTLET